MKACLITDDSKVVRKLARRIFEDLGFTCREAADGQEALKSCSEAMPEVMLMDWNMPMMNGVDCIRQLRQMPGGKTPKVIFCTTENDLAHIQTAIEAGADEYIMKPFDSDIIKDKLQVTGALE